MSTYNGWSNWETWKTNLEILDGMTAEDLNIEAYSVEDAYEAGTYLRDYVSEVIEGQYTYDGFIGGIVNDFLSSVNWTELAQGILEQWKIDNPEESEEESE